MTIAYSGDSITFPDNSVQNTAATGFGFKNRIINGAMVIDQRNAGARVAVTGFQFAVDRFNSVRANGATQTITSQRSTVAPAGFVNSLLYSVTTGGAVAAGDICYIGQSVEGFNTADFGWGTANAVPITLSFKARSSLTGTFGVILRGSTGAIAATYTISAANTFEDKTITFAAQTSGTWATDNSAGIQVFWDMGVGTTYSLAAGSYTAGSFYGVAGVTKLAATTGATFYITGVQLEKGSTATSFDYRPYGTELALCQRYYQQGFTWFGKFNSAVSFYAYGTYQVEMRAAPTATYIAGGSVSEIGVADRSVTAIPSYAGNNKGGYYQATVSGATSGNAGANAAGAPTIAGFSAEL